MKKLTLAAFAAILVGSIVPAAAQHQMQSHQMKPMLMQRRGDMSLTMNTAFMGLTPAEKRIAMGHWQHMSPAEHEVMNKRMKLCMADPHKDMMKHMHDMSMDMKMKHMMSGLTMGEQKTMRHMMSKMTPEQMKVGEKMMMNCCTYGMSHAGHGGHHMG
jgi:hypothetical protein